MKILILILLSFIFFSCDCNYDLFSGPRNRPPNKPSNPSPSDNATSVSIDTSWLHWECSDPDGDPISSFGVYFGTLSDPPWVRRIYGTSYDVGASTWFHLGTLDCETTYYWKISARSLGGDNVGDIWEFTTEENQPPDTPANPSPPDNATSVTVEANLNWECSDPENDPLTYDVYFGTSSNPPLVHSGQSSTTYYLETLNCETTYYWKIIAHDEQYYHIGDIWEFETIIFE